MEPKRFDAAVVGGGLAGLSAAAYLAKAGLSVLLLEKAARLGGRAATSSKYGAYLNAGVHAFYQGGEGEAALRELGVRLQGANPPASAAAIWNGGVYPMPADPFRLFASKLFSWEGKLELARLMATLGRLDPSSIGATTLREWAERNIREPMVRNVVYAICRANTFAPHPERQHAGLAVRQLQRTFRGKAFYPDYGWESIVRALERQAVEAGVGIVTDARVREIVRDADRFRLSVAHAGSALPPIEADAVLLACEPAEALRLVRGAERTPLAAWVGELRPIRAACLDVVLRRLTEPKRSFVAGFFLDAPLFYNNPTKVAKVAEHDAVVVHMIKHLGEAEGDAADDLIELERALDLLQPGWRAVETGRQYLPRMVVAYDYGTLPSVGARRGPRVPGMDGLFVAGDWAGGEHLLADAALASAKTAAQAIVQRRVLARN